VYDILEILDMTTKTHEELLSLHRKGHAAD